MLADFDNTLNIIEHGSKKQLIVVMWFCSEWWSIMGKQHSPSDNWMWSFDQL